MDQDSFPLNDTDSRENSARAAAIAAARLLLAEAAFSLKNIAEHDTAGIAPADNAAVLERLTSLAAGFDGIEASGAARALLQVPADLHQPLHGIFESAMRHISQEKNVAITSELQASLSEAIIQCLDATKLRGIANAEPGPIRLMVDLIDYLLDMTAAMQLMQTLWQLRGFEDLSLYSFWQQAETWIRARAANDFGQNRFWWPSVLEMMVDHYRPQLPDRLLIRYPDNQPVRATWQLDRAAFNGTVKIGAQGKPPQFLVPRMSTCPSLPGSYLPDGKQTARSANGVATVWYRNGTIHRDPKEGPALHSVEAHREITQYLVDGKLHRDHRDGPAIIDTNWDGQGVRSEEFFEHGTRHRPSSEGPAIWRTDRAGNIVQESYHEQGTCHRYPAEGPAWAGLEDGRYITAHMVNGVNHRPEGDGPAVTYHNPLTRHVTSEEYYRDGNKFRHLDYHPDGSLRRDTWYQDGVMHRDPSQGPAAIWSGNLEIRTQYFFEGRCHRDPMEGPASIVRDPDGQLIEVAYWVHGEEKRRYRSKRLRRMALRRIRRWERATRAGAEAKHD